MSHEGHTFTFIFSHINEIYYPKQFTVRKTIKPLDSNGGRENGPLGLNAPSLPQDVGEAVRM